MHDPEDGSRPSHQSPFIRRAFRRGRPTEPTPPEEFDPSGWEDITAPLLREVRLRDITKRLAWEWGLVLTARNVPHTMQKAIGAWRLLTPAEYREKAILEISAYEIENVRPAQPEVELPLRENTALTIGILLLVGLFHGIAQNQWQLFGYDASMAPIPWKALGLANCLDMVVHKEWWRSVTALTLHADAGHVLANIASGALFLVPLCRELGSGAGWLLTLTAASGANVLSCRLQGPSHASLGGSTAVFAAVGVLAALRAVNIYMAGRGSKESGLFDPRGPLLPLGAGLALLGFLGAASDARTDVVAHVCGFFCGIPVGGAAGLLLHRAGLRGPLPPRLSMLLGAAAAALVTGAWIRAFALP